LARNVVLYAGDGAVTVRRIPSVDVGDRTMVDADALQGTDAERKGIEVICEDQGPGIQAVEEVMSDSYPAGRGLGTGLSGTRRLMDEFDIISEVGVGTTVIVRKWLR